MKKIDWRIALGITAAMLAGLIIFPRESVWNVVFGLSLLACGGYWLFLLFKKEG